MQIHVLVVGRIHDCHTTPFATVGDLADAIATNYALDGECSLKIAGDIWDRATATDIAFAGVRDVELPVVELVDVTDYDGPWTAHTPDLIPLESDGTIITDDDTALAEIAAAIEGLTEDETAAFHDALLTLAGTTQSVPDGTIDDVLAWVDGNPDRASVALQTETHSTKPRSTLIAALEQLIIEHAAANATNA